MSKKKILKMLCILFVQTLPEDVKPQFDNFASNGAQTPYSRSCDANT